MRPSLNRLERDGKVVQIEPKSMDVLVDLAEHAGELRSKRRLLHVVWGDAFVTDDVLTRAISQLRKELGDDAKNPKYIETIPRQGYRLVAPRTEPEKKAFRYRILEKLGGGGMGVVYRAEDTLLRRIVALKFLPAELSENSNAKERFLQEARAAARLIHPNIAVVHDVGEDPEGRMYIAMDCYDGETIKKKVARGALPIDQSLDLAIQISRGLAAAHAEGIVHRDIKPANVMVTKDGSAKIVDFGLAKLAGTASLTRTGGAPGTAAYMSPEQLLGHDVDHRTDLWSLGVVLYEMLAGKRPFGGDSAGSAVQSILQNDPSPLSDSRPDCPQAAEDVAHALLRKDPSQRPESAAEVAESLASAKLASDLTEPMPEELLDRLERRSKASSDVQVAEKTGPPEQLRTARKRPWWGLSVVASLALMVVALAIWASWAAFERHDDSTSLGHPRQLTAGPSWEAEPAISPDGEFIAYSSNLSGNAAIWLIDARGGEPIQLTDDPASDHAPSWFPDGRTIAFHSDRSGEIAIWKVPRLGGPATMLVPGGTNPAISPDGTRIAFSKDAENGMARIAVASLLDPDRATILTGDDDGFWNHQDPSWSPDGEAICYSDSRDLWVVPAAGGAARRLTLDDASDYEPVWSAGGRHLLFSSHRDQTTALWRVSLAGGPPKRLTSGIGPERHPTISRDGSKLAYSTFAQDMDVELVDLITGERSRLPEYRFEGEPTLAPDRRAVVFNSDRIGGFRLWRQPLSGVRPVRNAALLSEDPGASSNPHYSPDGRWIAYQRRMAEQRDIWLQPASGGLPQPVTSDPEADYHPTWSPDGSLIAFVSERGGSSGLWVARVADGKLVGPLRQIPATVSSLMSPAWSADGALISFAGVQQERWEVWIVPSDGSGPSRRVTEGADAHRVRWFGNQGTLLVMGYWGGGKVSLREVDSQTGTSTEIETLAEVGPLPAGGPFDISADGRILALTVEEVSGDLWIRATKAGSS
ncbi:MAG: protein kinase [bacterium]|nr:protein kinase [bacterium]